MTEKGQCIEEEWVKVKKGIIKVTVKSLRRKKSGGTKL
jgi:hypothetical protein